VGRQTAPMASEILGVREAQPANVRISDDYLQTLAMILGYDDKNRIPLRCSPSGVLATSSPRLVDVFHWASTGATEAKQGDNLICTEVLCIGHPDNSSKVWVRTNLAATVDNAIPLDAGDVMGFSVRNLNELHALIVASGEKLIVGYTV